MVLSWGGEEGKEIPRVLTESRKARQKASALQIRECGGYEKGAAFHSGKKLWQKKKRKNGDQKLSPGGIKRLPVSFLNQQKSTFKTQLN